MNQKIKKFNIFFIVCFCFCFATDNVFAANKAAGSTLFNFLKLPLNASQAAVSGINIFDISSSASNPAIIPFCFDVLVSASYASYFQGTSFNSFDITVPLKKGICGINISYGGFNYGELERYIEDSGGGYIRDGTFGANDSFFQLAYGRIIYGDFYGGINAKYIRQTIDGDNIDGYSLGGSVIYMPDASWYASAGIDNIGPSVDGYDLPSRAYVSFANEPEDLDAQFVYAFEASAFFDKVIVFKAGCEFNWERKFFLRAGYAHHVNNKNDSLGEWYEKNLSLGFGIKYGIFSVDYTWLPFGQLGDTNMISLHLKF